MRLRLGRRNTLYGVRRTQISVDPYTPSPLIFGDDLFITAMLAFAHARGTHAPAALRHNGCACRDGTSRQTARLRHAACAGAGASGTRVSFIVGLSAAAVPVTVARLFAFLSLRAVLPAPFPAFQDRRASSEPSRYRPEPVASP